MLTRAAVARRLGKSIATVRRLEAAGELNPDQGWRGVRLFDEDEVGELRQRFVDEGSVPAAHSRWFARNPGERPTPTSARAADDDNELRALQRENSELRERLEVVRSAIDLWLEIGPRDEVLEALDAALGDRS